MFDTHCHLNFKAFDDNVDEVIAEAKKAGVNFITIPGTDIPTSKKAVAIAEKNKGIYAACGIHPHHVYEKHQKGVVHESVGEELKEIEALLSSEKVVAIGEIGLDRYIYQRTKYGQYAIDENFIALQKTFFIKQLELAKLFNKSVIVHNREAKQDLLPLLSDHWDSFFEGRMVLHCCEPDEELLEFAKEKKLFLGVDGDVTYWEKKAEFIKKVPVELLVLETDSPFLIPEPLKSHKVFPNKPENLKIIAEFVAQIRGESFETFTSKTAENAKKLFQVT